MKYLNNKVFLLFSLVLLFSCLNIVSAECPPTGCLSNVSINIVEEAVTPPTDGGGGGGGGGSICTPVWDCGSWGLCLEGIQTRECIKLNTCFSNINKPDIEKTCSVIGSIIEIIGSPVIDPIITKLNCGDKPTVGEWGECNSNDVTTRINYECSLETNFEWLSYSEDKLCSTNNVMLSSFGNFFTETTPDLLTKSITSFFNSIWDFILGFFKMIWDFISFWN